MDFHTYTTMRDWARRCAQDRYPGDLDGFYREMFTDAARMHSGQLLGQGKNERDYRRPHMTLVWTGHGRAMPKIVPRRGSVVHREVVEKVPMGWEG